MNDQPKRSLFARALADLLDNTDLHGRGGWARLLGVPRDAIDRWTNDETVPRADLLRMVLDVLRSSSNIKRDPIADFELMAQEHALDVSPLGWAMLPSVASYIERSSVAEFGRDLATLTRSQQQRVLVHGGWDSDMIGNLPPRLRDPRDLILIGKVARDGTEFLIYATLYGHLRVVINDSWKILFEGEWTRRVDEPVRGSWREIHAVFPWNEADPWMTGMVRAAMRDGRLDRLDEEGRIVSNDQWIATVDGRDIDITPIGDRSTDYVYWSVDVTASDGLDDGLGSRISPEDVVQTAWKNLVDDYGLRATAIRRTRRF